jgi:Ser/Thr protein kinase RdoA (MazF antagonist)
MLPIPELVRVARLLDDHWHCQLAERAAARWGAADAVFVRSSASHVFVARQASGGSRIVLRMRPESTSAKAILHRSAMACEQLSRAGAPVVAAVRSRAGALVESVDDYCITAVALADGEVRDEDTANRSTAADWGAALAELHLRGAAVDLAQLPDMVDLCAPQDATSAQSQPMDSRLRGVADEVAADLAALPRDPAVRGLLHGDPELDNVVFTANGPVLVDLDDVRTGWRAADVGFALRSWAVTAAAPDLAAEIPAAFLAGYRRRRPITDQELTWLPLFARAAALETLRELAPLLAHPAEPSWPAWATELDERIRTRADDLSAALLRRS